MSKLGFQRFALMGHDRGARVARRLALDHPDTVTQLAVLDIVPVLDLYDNFGSDLAQDYFYFNFLTQPHPLPERLIAGDAEGFMRQMLFGLAKNATNFEASALSAYLSSSTRPETISAMCDCFRAGFNVDRVHDFEDRRAGRRIICPTLIAWGEDGVIGKRFDLQQVWRRWCIDPTFAPMPCGHFIPDEAPDEMCRALIAFLASGAD